MFAAASASVSLPAATAVVTSAATGSGQSGARSAARRKYGSGSSAVFAFRGFTRPNICSNSPRTSGGMSDSGSARSFSAFRPMRSRISARARFARSAGQPARFSASHASYFAQCRFASSGSMSSRTIAWSRWNSGSSAGLPNSLRYFAKSDGSPCVKIARYRQRASRGSSSGVCLRTTGTANSACLNAGPERLVPAEFGANLSQRFNGRAAGQGVVLLVQPGRRPPAVVRPGTPGQAGPERGREPGRQAVGGEPLPVLQRPRVVPGGVGQEAAEEHLPIRGTATATRPLAGRPGRAASSPASYFWKASRTASNAGCDSAGSPSFDRNRTARSAAGSGGAGGGAGAAVRVTAGTPGELP